MKLIQSTLATLALVATLFVVGCASHAKSGFVVVETDKEIFVAMEGTEAGDALATDGEIAKPVTAIGAKVDGKKIQAADEDTLAAYLGW